MSGLRPTAVSLSCEEVPFGGWARAARLSNGIVELVASLEVGPRLLHFAFTGGESPLLKIARHAGCTGGDTWRMYGGHRLWHAPEKKPRTYAPDNAPVLHTWNGVTLTLEPTPEASTGIAKRIDVALEPNRPVAHLRLRLTNVGPWPVELAPWSLTAMRQGGRAIFPRDPRRPHEDTTLLPVSTMALWSYSDMSDPRWTWGSRYVQLRQDPGAAQPTKFGYANRQGWAAYAVDDLVFVHRYAHVAGARYPDLGCNCESFTNSDFLELESLGPLSVVEPGAFVEHAETWLLAQAAIGTSEDEIDRVLQPLVRAL